MSCWIILNRGSILGQRRADTRRLRVRQSQRHGSLLNLYPTNTYANHFKFPIPSRTQLIRAATCDLALAFGEGQDGDRDKRMSRPFGVALLLAGYDDLDGPQLFFSDPSGTFVRYKAKAIGAGSEGAQSNLQESYNEDMTLEEAEELALGTLKQVMEEKINTDNVELARVVPGKGFHIATTEEVGSVLERLS